MGHFGFSYVGLVFLLMLTVPNLIWSKNRPRGYETSGENKILLAFERSGEILVTGCALIFSDFNFRARSWWSLWLAAAFLLMLLYEFGWIRYFRSEKTLADFYRSLCGIPVAGATLPVGAFFLLGIYGRSVWMLASVVILGVGHIGIHLQHRKALRILPAGAKHAE